MHEFQSLGPLIIGARLKS
jgi:hypothetical protein